MAIKLVRQVPRIPQMPRTLRDPQQTEAYFRAQNIGLYEWYRDYQERLNAAHNLPSFRVHRNGSNQTAVVSGVATKIQFTSTTSSATVEGFDDWGYFDLTTNYRYTPQIAGKYLFGLHVLLVTPTVETVLQSVISKNGYVGGVNAIHRTIMTTGTTQATITGNPTTLFTMNGKTDYVEFNIVQTSGANKDINGAADVTFAWGHKVSD